MKSIAKRCRSKDEALEVESALISRCVEGSIDLIAICPVGWRQRELKQGAPWLVFARPQPSAVFFDDGAADRQPHAHAVGFCREEWLEQLFKVVRAQAGTRIPHRDAHRKMRGG